VKDQIYEKEGRKGDICMYIPDTSIISPTFIVLSSLSILLFAPINADDGTDTDDDAADAVVVVPVML